MKRLSCISLVFFLWPFHDAGAQSIETGLGLIHSRATYKNYRDQRAYTNLGFPEKEWYTMSGLYLNTFDGSFLCYLIDKPRFMIGEYLRVGVGMGYLYSNVFDKVKDNGDLTIGYYGVNGTTEVYSPGPVQKSKLGFWIDFNYGLQAQFRIRQDFMIGSRLYYRIHVNPTVDDYRSRGAVNAFSGVIGLFGIYERVSALVEFDRRHTSADYTNASYFALTARCRLKNTYYTYFGMRYDRIKPYYPPNSVLSGGYNSVMLTFGAAIFTK